MPVHERASIVARAPRTAGNLLKLRERVLPALGVSLNEKDQVNDFKLNTGRYGSLFYKDLGLCYEISFTHEACQNGKLCKWRHDALMPDEKAWITDLGAGEALAWMNECYATPQVPDPKDWYATQVM